MNYEIRITGEGTAKQIAAALRQVARDIQEAADRNEELDGVNWEDPVLMTEIKS
jgi:hypothetical protein